MALFSKPSTGSSSESSSILDTIFWGLKTSLIVSTSAVGLALLALYTFQRKIVYPSSLDGSRKKVSTPDEYGLPYESVDIHTKDGETLQSFLLLHDENDANYSNKTVLILSPNAGNIGYFLPVVKYIYSELNYNVFIYSYRGYGKSTGSPSEDGLKIDAESVMKYISEREQLAASSIVCYGRSIGGAVAIYMAYKHPELVSGLILDNTFLSIQKVIPYLFPVLGPVSFLCHEKWPSETYIKDVSSDIPVLFMSSQKDEIVPPDHMRKLYKLSKSTCKTWKIYPKAHHNDTILAPGYWDDFYDFMHDRINPIGK